MTDRGVVVVLIWDVGRLELTVIVWCVGMRFFFVCSFLVLLSSSFGESWNVV